MSDAIVEVALRDAECIDRAHVAAALADLAGKLARGEVHASHSSAMVELRRAAMVEPDRRSRAELFLVAVVGDEPVPRMGDVLVGFRSPAYRETETEVRLRVGPHLLGPVRVPGFGRTALALDGAGVLPLVALAFHEVRVEASPAGLVSVQAHLDPRSRRQLAVFGGRFCDRVGRAILVGSGHLHVASSAAEPHPYGGETFLSERRFHDLALP